MSHSVISLRYGFVHRVLHVFFVVKLLTTLWVLWLTTTEVDCFLPGLCYIFCCDHIFVPHIFEENVIGSLAPMVWMFTG